MADVVSTPTFLAWFEDLADPSAQSRIAKRIARFEADLFGDTRSVGHGVSEARIDYGPGYRLYFARRSGKVVVLLCGGDKASQARDIARAQSMVLDI